MSRFKSMDVEENVGCNLIPMIDIMFLLLLFFMLSADMSQRVTEDIKLPEADMVKEDPKKKEGYETTTVNLVGELENWHVVIAGHHYIDWDHLKVALHELAHQPGEEEPGNPAGSYFSTRAIQLRAASDAPYKHVQRLIQMCSKAGFYKIEVVATKPDPTKT
jgi:biopolymer transport protein ExbD